VSSALAPVRPLTLSPDVWIAQAPPQLVEDTRAGFREVVVELITRAAAARADEITIDLAATEEVDASGLGLLVLAQRRARDHKMTVRLVNVRSSVRQLMELTRLDFLFHIAA
jgi:anti-anti-sigma factor